MNASAETTPWQPPDGTQGLIFDCDGTLADTMPVHFVAWTAMLAEHGIAFPEEQFYALGGMPSGRIIRLLADQAGVTVTDVAAMIDHKEGLYVESIASVTRIEPVCTIAERFAGGLPLAVASGGQRAIVERTLAAIDLADVFPVIVAAEDTERHKPEPDPFLEAARRLALAPARCVVFEDTDFGLEAAERAGMVGVDVRSWR